MAHTARGARLTERHRADQATLTRRLVDVLRDIFTSTWDPTDVNRSTERFTRKALPVVLESREYSATMAARYLDTFSKVETAHVLRTSGATDKAAVSIPEADLRGLLGVDLTDRDRIREALMDLPTAEEVAADLARTHNAAAKSRIRKDGTPVGVEEARDYSAKRTAARSIRLVSDGGRGVISREVKSGGRGAVGYARVIDANPCPFCAMLASRGPVYRSNAFTDANALFTGDNAFKVHDGCECSLEPVYGRSGAKLPPGSEQLAQEWADVAAGRPNPAAYWRRWRESGTLPGEEKDGALGTDSADRQVSKKKKKARNRPAGPGRKAIEDMDQTELEKTLKGMYVRRDGLRSDLAALESRGVVPGEPGPAQAIQKRLDTLEKNISNTRERLVKLSG